MKDDIASKLNVCLSSQLDFSAAGKPQLLTSLDLLTWKRLDVIAKYLYARDFNIGVKNCWSLDLYREHLLVWNNFHEMDNSGKNSFNKYYDDYIKLINSISQNGFNSEKSIIPIDQDNVIIDGSHRLGACLASGAPLLTTKFDYSGPVYDANYFLNIGLKKEFVEAMLLEYCRLKKQTRVAVFFPIAEGPSDEDLAVLSGIGDVIYRVDFTFSELGKVNLMRVLYRGEHWLESSVRSKDTSALDVNIIEKFGTLNICTFVVFECTEEANLIAAKAKIRSRYTYEKNSLHINDTHGQTIDLLDLLFSLNGQHWLNNARTKHMAIFHKLLGLYHSNIFAKPGISERFCLGGSSPLALYGLREVSDLDYIYYGTDPLDLSFSDSISSHKDQLIFYHKTPEELIYSPQAHIKFFGIKILSLNALSVMKKRRNESKDIQDLALIEGIHQERSIYESIRSFYGFAVRKYRFYKHKYRMKLLHHIPPSLKKVLKRLYFFAANLFESIGSEQRKLSYLGYTLSYSAGTSIVQRLRIHSVYEPEVSGKLRDMLSDDDEPVLLDIGANIGLITLNLCSVIGGLKVHAFEPGPHQFSYLKMNVEDNDLGDRVTIYNKALSDSKGTLSFFSHSKKHSSGDGFFDTGRAGKSKEITVETGTLNDWWSGSNSKKVSVIKIDTEGAELMILRGATLLLKIQRPLLLIEIHPINLDAYPYSVKDLFEFLAEFGYSIYTLDGQLANVSNIENMFDLKKHDFVCQPNLRI